MQGNRNVIVFGTLGVGKSTLMNRIAGSDQFQTSDGSEGCTQKVARYEIPGKGITVIDTPGTNDPDMSLDTWVASLRDHAQSN